jgi:hypothetical protein
MRLRSTPHRQGDHSAITQKEFFIMNTPNPLQAAATQANDHIDLALANANRKNIASFIQLPERRPGSVMLATATPPDPSSINDLLAKSSQAPGATSIATVPASASSSALALLQQVQLLDSYVSVVAALVVYNARPQGYDLSKPTDASQFVIDFANAKNYAITGGAIKKIQAYLPLASAKTQTLSKQTTSVDLHMDLLNALFAGFGLTASAMAELDGILTNVTNTLKSLTLSFNTQTQTLNHFVSYYYFADVPGAPAGLHQMRVRMFYLQLSQSSWKAAIGKSSVSNFTLDMSYVDIECSMDSMLVAQDVQSIEDSINALTGQDSKAIAKLVGVKGINADPVPS